LISSNDASRIRADHAKTILQKTRSVHDGVVDDLRRCEGGKATVDDILGMLGEMLEGVKQDFQAGEDQSRSEGARDALVEIVAKLEGHRTHLTREAAVFSGRRQQCGHLIDLLGAIADAETAEANRVHERPEGGPGHPGASLAQQRRAEATPEGDSGS
jgi:hypothetical protein